MLCVTYCILQVVWNNSIFCWVWSIIHNMHEWQCFSVIKSNVHLIGDHACWFLKWKWEGFCGACDASCNGSVLDDRVSSGNVMKYKIVILSTPCEIQTCMHPDHKYTHMQILLFVISIISKMQVLVLNFIVRMKLMILTSLVSLTFFSTVTLSLALIFGDINSTFLLLIFSIRFWILTGSIAPLTFNSLFSVSISTVWTPGHNDSAMTISL